MRIVAGRWGGRRIDAPRGTQVRPTADRVREAWMSIVAPWLPGARVLDLFAGSGALGLEAISRGAERADFVEQHPRSLRTLTGNIAALDAGNAAVVHRGDGLRFVAGLAAGSYDVAFADPPYAHGLAASVAEQWLAVPFATLLGIEHGAREAVPAGGDTRRYGDTALTFYGLDSRR
ncbi:MAG TPA: 16S rRNA (guanine(966)-N(2))-methyltransferase RsmD [Gemmatimonadaceae bacterium]|nr:16S rRNA (guanine(966)-N(2))-methyltransferase RsmD [Gemmatimonadaceae bacterium]